jgi:hypothetical protein
VSSRTCAADSQNVTEGGFLLIQYIPQVGEMARYDKDAIKDAARGKWAWIISRLTGVSESVLEIGRAHV